MRSAASEEARAITQQRRRETKRRRGPAQLAAWVRAPACPRTDWRAREQGPACCWSCRGAESARAGAPVPGYCAARRRGTAAPPRARSLEAAQPLSPGGCRSSFSLPAINYRRPLGGLGGSKLGGVVVASGDGGGGQWTHAHAHDGTRDGDGDGERERKKRRRRKRTGRVCVEEMHGREAAAVAAVLGKERQLGVLTSGQVPMRYGKVPQAPPVVLR